MYITIACFCFPFDQSSFLLFVG